MNLYFFGVFRMEISKYPDPHLLVGLTDLTETGEVLSLREENQKLHKILKEVVKVHVISDELWDSEAAVEAFIDRALSKVN